MLSDKYQTFQIEKIICSILSDNFTVQYNAELYFLTQRWRVPSDIAPINLYAFGRYNPELYKSKKSESACFLVEYLFLNLINAIKIDKIILKIYPLSVRKVAN